MNCFCCLSARSEKPFCCAITRDSRSSKWRSSLALAKMPPASAWTGRLKSSGSGLGVAAFRVAPAALIGACAIPSSAQAVALAEPSANAVAIATQVSRLLTLAKLKLVAAGVAACLLLVIGGIVATTLPKSQQMATAALPASPPADIVKVTDAALSGPMMAAGWPIALPGSITSTPSVADLDGDGKLEVIVTCMARVADPSYVHPRPSGSAAVCRAGR